MVTRKKTARASPSKKAEIKAQQDIQLSQDNSAEVVEAAYPNRIEINVNITAHEDLKIAQDMAIEKGQVISDRIPEKSRLHAQQKQLELSLERVRAASIAPPPKPRNVPDVAALPPVNYLEQNAAIALGTSFSILVVLMPNLTLRQSLAVLILLKFGVTADWKLLISLPIAQLTHHYSSKQQNPLVKTTIDMF